MSAEPHNTLDELRGLMARRGVSEAALCAMTDIEPDRLAQLLGETAESSGSSTAVRILSDDENMRLSTLTAQLTHGLEIDDDDRLRGMLQSLTIECRLTPTSVAALTGVADQDIHDALDDPAALDSDLKYGMSTKVSYLINAVNQARRR